MKIYKFDKIKTGFFSIHSFIREKIPLGNYPSMTNANYFFIQLNNPPDLPYEEEIEQITFANKSLINLECHVAFDNRHDVEKGSPRGKPKLFYHNDALEKFCFKAGLEKTNTSLIEFLGQNNVVKNKYNIHNTFRITGDFKIINLERFINAVKFGIGSRKNYGFGLIIWR
jgi:hypothetical protein